MDDSFRVKGSIRRTLLNLQLFFVSCILLSTEQPEERVQMGGFSSSAI